MREKLERVIFYLLIFAVPVQVRVILFEWTKPFNQWTSAYLYGTDLLLGALFIFWLFGARSQNLNLQKQLWKSDFHSWVWISNFQHLLRSNLNSGGLTSTGVWLVIFFLISVLSIFNFHIISLSLYQLLKLAEFIGFYFYLKSNIGKIFSFHGVLITIIASGLFQSVIAIAQYLKQGSIGLRLLGEGPLSVNTTGVAVFIADGEKYLRAYGTAPHPNILAAWLFVAIFAFYFLWLYSPKSNLSEFNSDRLSTGWRLGVYIILLFGFFFTFSRVIIGFWVLGMLARFLIVFLKKEFRGNLALRRSILTLTGVSLAVAIIFSMFFWSQVNSRIHISAQEEAVTQRVYYNKIAGSMTISQPLLGVGIGQFIPDFMSKFKHLPANAYQPVHNIYLLIASETGFIGLGAFLLFLFFSFWQFIHRADFKKLSSYSFLIFITSFLIVGIFDHFLWTSQQGSLIFWSVLALISYWAKPTL